MRELWRRTALLAAAGFALGALVGLGFLAAYGFQAATGGLARYIVLSGLLGAVNMGTTVVYALERWSVMRCTLTHFVITMGSVCAVGFTLGWLSPREPVTLWILAGCVVVYFIIWLIMYRLYKRRIRRINDALTRWKAEQDGE